MGCAAPPSRTPPPSSAGLQDCGFGLMGDTGTNVPVPSHGDSQSQPPDPAVVGSEVDALVAKMRITWPTGLEPS